MSLEMLCSMCQKSGPCCRVVPWCGHITCKLCRRRKNPDECPHCGMRRPRLGQADDEKKDPIPQITFNDTTLCANHMKPCEYFCKQCSTQLCGDCIFEQLTSKDSVHSGHDILKLSAMVDAKDALRKEMVELRTSMESIDVALENFERQINSQRGKADDVMLIAYNSFKQIDDRFQAAVREVRRPFADAAEALQKQALVVANLVEEAESILTSSDVSGTACAQDYLDRLSTQLDSLKVTNVPTDVNFPDNQLVPKMETVTYEIPDFLATVEKYRAAKKDDVTFIYSNAIKMFGGVWRVKIYPNGIKDGLNKDISVFLELLKAPSASGVYYYTMTVKGKNGMSVFREFSSEFRQMDSWGWNRAAPLDLLDDQFLLGENKTLRLEIGLCPISYETTYNTYKATYEKIIAKIAELEQRNDS